MNNPIEPNTFLGETIVNALIQEGIFLEESKANFMKALLDGKLKESDWKLVLETSLNKQELLDNESTEAGA
jgi:hypothetical protein